MQITINVRNNEYTNMVISTDNFHNGNLLQAITPISELKV